MDQLLLLLGVQERMVDLVQDLTEERVILQCWLINNLFIYLVAIITQQVSLKKVNYIYGVRGIVVNLVILVSVVQEYPSLQIFLSPYPLCKWFVVGNIAWLYHHVDRSILGYILSYFILISDVNFLYNCMQGLGEEG